MNITYLLFGSNEGDRFQWLQTGEELTRLKCGVIKSISSIYQTAAWGLEEQPDFLNQVICIETALSANELLNAVQDIENQLGRQRQVKWGQRTLDIDILLFNNDIIDQPNLSIPHPFLDKRRFTLAPLCEIAPNLVHPLSHKSMALLLQECTDPLAVKKIEIKH